ncbi:hypothetical protein HELRODRAFT_194253 [Helobdella robusta]|uniref:Protein phosphatase 1 regulatory subunit 21 N-terminal domain-containing protein n=1 Tax=Helobdella robusta TaxID=6412 RepID=T1FVV3_HELRO|nr:hypothetical protein HELRODRAFT_194253 [Helobdella robusta]ESN92418.1 hypothetical protein HELRODRAFT_194253 [Helobdella robusta]
MADLQSKYQVLATEYAKACLQFFSNQLEKKVRAQISVLKKAVLDEQSSSQGLKEQLKERDQMIRKHEQELESLTFRNQQLESRVTILQTELISVGSGKSKKMKIKALQTDLDKRATLLDDLKLGHEDKMKKLMEEKNSLESKLAEQSALVERTLEKTDQLEKELNNVQTKLTLENERLVKIINDNISFIDNSDETLTIFNLSKVPHPSPSSSSKIDSTHIRDLIFLANQIISEEMMTSFEAIFDAMQAKSIDPKLNSDLFKVYKEQSLRLAERPTYIQPIRKGFATLCDLYNDNNENSTLPLSCLSSLTSSTAAAATAAATSSSSSSSSNATILELSNAIFNWMEATNDLSRSFGAKLKTVEELPTCHKNIKLLDERLNGSIIKLHHSIQKLSSFLSLNVNQISSSVSASSSTSSLSSSSLLNALRKRAINYLAAVSQNVPSDSVPHSIAIENKKAIVAYMESKSELTQQLGNINIVDRDRDERQPPQQQKQHQQRQVELETEWDQTREKIVMENYERRISELIANLQLADSKALYFNSECKAIHKQLTSTNLDRERLRVDLVSSNDVMSRLKDELQTTTKNYEVQLSLMSEHLATMNEKLTSQKDEIDALKFNIQHQQQHQQQQQQQKQQHHHSPVATLLSLSGSGGGSKKSK